MKDKLDFKANDVKLGSLLKRNDVILKIPPYQRPYSWKEEQINDFWNDINTDEQAFFLGSIILNKEDEKHGYIEVIDGQQRLLTTTMFIAATRNILNDLGQKRLADASHRTFIAFEDEDGNQTYKIKTADKTAEFFEKFIQTPYQDVINAEANSKEEIRIKKNYSFLYEKIQNALKDQPALDDKINKIKDLRKKLSDLIIIEMEIFSDEVAYEIFETVNARGADLTVADLLKNLIFKKIKNKEKKEKAKIIWSDIESLIEETNIELKVFIRHYWLSKHKFVTEKKLYVDIKNTISDWFGFIKDLHESAKWYNIIKEGSRKDFDAIEKGDKIYRSIFSIKLMNVSQVNVMLLALLSNHEKIGGKLIGNLLDYIEKFTFKYSSVCKMPGNAVERLYSKYSIEFSNQMKKNFGGKHYLSNIQRIIQNIKSELKNISPLKEMFLERFDDIKYRNSTSARQLIKYILEEFEKNEKGFTGETKLDFDSVNIEHILPQNPVKWGYSKKDVNDYVNNLGNLCLLHFVLNSAASDSKIEKKLDDILKTEIKSTLSLANSIKENNYTWNEEEIVNRQKNMGILAFDKIWKL